MKGRPPLLLLVTLLPLLLLLLLAQMPAAAQMPPVPGQPAGAPQEAEETEPDAFILHLVAAANLTRAATIAQPLERRTAVVSRLQDTARASQAALLRELQQRQAAGEIAGYQSLWIINAVVVEGSKEVAEALADRPEVSHLTPDVRLQYFDPEAARAAVASAGAPAPWGIAAVRAPYAWHGLGVNGQGITVAIVDSGVDWQHPALQANYRGTVPGAAANHEDNWFDALDPANKAPFDPNGHGTHIAGTAVGQSGLGVAPGAHWMAVRAFDEYGFATLSAIHLGLQWLLAPGGDPALAPDVVNGSWGNPSADRVFEPDVRALQAAGIITVFSAGNQGPDRATIGIPASYADTIAVAASDPEGKIAWFSSAGPSALTAQHKPTLAAPGAAVLSALPGGLYGYANGTSMAAPHVTGAVALLLSAQPNLSGVQVTAALTRTAAPLGAPQPDFHAGWGLLDAYASVAPFVAAGELNGTVRSEGRPVVGAQLTVTTAAGVSLLFRSDEQGRYQATLRPGVYHLSVSHFGYDSRDVGQVEIVAGVPNLRNVELVPLTGGALSGRVRRAGSQSPLRAAIRVLNTPLETTAAADGSFALSLPAGSYRVQARLNGYAVAAATVTVPAGGAASQDFPLESHPTLLLVDGAAWYYRSQASYYRAALDGLGYAYDEWAIDDPYNHLPTAGDLGAYDIVLWSAPLYSPGLLGADAALAHYLEGGGKLFISGQNVASIDGFFNGGSYWWHELLQAELAGEAQAPFSLVGAAQTPFSGLRLSLNGADSANNQTSPDQVSAGENSLTQPVLHYADGATAALSAGRCRPYRILYFGFGLEGASTAAARRQLLAGALGHLTAPPQAAGLQLTPETIDGYIEPGQTLSYTLQLVNLSENRQDTVELSLSSGWQATISAERLTLEPCSSVPVTLTLTASALLPQDTANLLQVVATSVNDPRSQVTVSAHHQTPGGELLLVSDERWYDQEEHYRALLAEVTAPPDVWDTASLGSPSAHFLQQYDTVLWYTGYDWFEPVTDEELEALEAYVQAGGRLFLTSQDYLAYHDQAPFSRDLLGVLGFRESLTSTLLLAGDNTLSGEGGGPFRLDYDRYQNFSDGLVPTASSRPYIWSDQGMAAGLATAGDNWRTIFWAFPLETLPLPEQSHALQQALGWLGDLGDSSFAVDERAGLAPRRHYTLTLHNLATASSHRIWVTNTLPAELSLDAVSLQGASYDTDAHQLIWQGDLAPGESHQIRYQATIEPGTVPGTQLVNRAAIRHDGASVRFERSATTWVAAPDLGDSDLQPSHASLVSGERFTYTAHLVNNSEVAATTVSSTLRLPPGLHPSPDAVHTTAGSVDISGREVRWRGAIPAGQTVILTVVVSPRTLQPIWMPALLLVDDGVTTPLARAGPFYLEPARFHLPFVFR